MGLMGVLADSVLEAGGRVTGVIPDAMVEKELAHQGIQDLLIVETLHERKAAMAELSDGFLALPGGLGTLEEFFEALTWGQLGLHDKPVGLLNVEGYFDGMLSFIDHAVEHGFVQSEHGQMVISDVTAQGVLNRMRDFQPPRLPTSGGTPRI